MDVFVLPAASSAPSVMMGLSLAVLGAWVALDTLPRVPQARSRAIALRWLLAASGALAAGMWASQALVAGAVGVAASAAGQWRYGVAGALAAFGVAWLGFLLAFLALTRRGGVAALALVASGLVALSVLLQAQVWAWSAELTYASAAGGLGLALGTLWCALLAFVSLWAYLSGAGPRADRPMLLRHTLAALGLGLGLLVAQALHLGSAAAWAEPGLHTASGVPASALVLLAVVGGPAVLLIMLVASRLEAQMRQSLDDAKQRLNKQRQLDPLTLLPGRALFETQLLDAAHAVDAQGGSLALMVINLDGFKPLNESFGHDKGDLMLREEAERLRALSGPQVAVARLGADAFLLLHSGNPSEEQTVALANRVLLELGKACMVGGREAVLSCSVGIALYPQHGAVTTLLAHAELAMRAAKATGGAAYAFFEAHMASGVKDQMDLLRELRGALTGRQLSVYYQPKVHAPSGDITGAEALMRWNHPKRGLISPEVFIPIAERFGLIGALGNWLIDEVCQQIHLWREEGLRMRVAINLSVHQLRQTDLPDRIAQALQRNGVNPDLLTCEITETVAMEDIQATQQVFARLAQVGVHIAIDDFGTGYSSLAYLRKLPAEELKIDRSFVHDLATSADARAVVDAVVKLAQALGLKLVAEGVETQEQFEILRSLGCHELQGFYFAKPMSAKALGLWAISDNGPSNVGFRHSLFEETKPAPMG